MSIGAKIGAAFAVVLAIIAAFGVRAYVDTQRLLDANRMVAHTHEVIEAREHVLSVLKDAETGQRGFLLTGEDKYLEPYNAATREVQRDIDKLAKLTLDTAQQENLQQVRKLADAKLAELRKTIQLRRKSGLQAALPIILTDRGKKIMDDLRGVVAEMKDREQQLLDARNAAADAAASRTLWAVAVWMPIALLVLAIAAVALMRSVRFGGPAARLETPGKKWSGIAVRYASALTIVAVAVAVRWRLETSFGALPYFITLYPAVLLAASIGGGGPGIVATVLAALAADYWFIPPYGQFSIDAPNDVLALGIFAGAGLFLSVLAERLRRARWAEATSAAQEQQLEELSRLNEALSQQSEELAQQNEELSQQSEELSQQSEELAQQNEELQSQSEEIQALNAELTHREEILQKLVDAARLGAAEQAVMQEICAAGQEMFGPAAAAVIVFEQQGDRLLVRAQAGLGPAGANAESWPVQNSFAEVAIAENKTAALADAALRPDIALIHPPGEQPFRAVLAAPMGAAGRSFGAVGVYSRQAQEWTAEQFRLAEWLAAQCAHILETLRLQQAVARERANLQAVFDVVNVGMLVIGEDGAVKQVNDTLSRWVRKDVLAWEGGQPGDFVGCVHALANPAGCGHSPQCASCPIRNAFASVLRTGQPIHDVEAEAILSVGGSVAPLWLEVSADPLVLDGKRHVILAMSNISERKRAEEAMARLGAIVESSDDAILSKDLNGVIQTWNAGAERLFGYRAEEVVGQPIALLLPPERIREEEQILERLLRGERVEHLETVRVAKDGRRIDASVTVSPVRGPDGRIVGASKIVRDIADRKRAEYALRERAALLDLAHDAIIVRGAGDKIAFWNRGAEETYGWTPVEAMGRVIHEILKTRFPKPLAEIAADMAEKGHWEGELTHARKDGREIVVASRWAVQRDDSGRQVSVLEINRDITERKRAEEDSRAARDSAEKAKGVAERANRAKDHFLAVLSHELRTPLTPVAMGVSMLQERSDLDPAAHEILEMARRNIAMEAGLIDDLLDVARIARGKIELQKQRGELCKIIHRAVEVCKPDIEARGLQFAVDLGPAAPYWVDADVSRLQQVFWNLLKNAIKFTPHGGRVDIRCRPNEDHVLVEVSDSGIGIEPEALPRIFNAFEQAELSITRQFGGLGLGLAISKALVEMHGGTISAESGGRNKGTTFCIRLPLCAGQPAGNARRRAAARRPSAAHSPRRRPRRHGENDADGADRGRPRGGNRRRRGRGSGTCRRSRLRLAD